MKSKIAASIIICFSFYGCSPSEKSTNNNQEWESPSGYLFPTLLANEQIIWNVNGTASDTLTYGMNEFTFRLENFNEYTSGRINPNIRISKIKKISFELLSNSKPIKTYYPQILDSIGKLIIEFNSDTLATYQYNVNMDLKFAKTDSTYRYNGKIKLVNQ